MSNGGDRDDVLQTPEIDLSPSNTNTQSISVYKDFSFGEFDLFVEVATEKTVDDILTSQLYSAGTSSVTSSTAKLTQQTDFATTTMADSNGQTAKRNQTKPVPSTSAAPSPVPAIVGSAPFLANNPQPIHPISIAPVAHTHYEVNTMTTHASSASSNCNMLYTNSVYMHHNQRAVAGGTYYADISPMLPMMPFNRPNKCFIIHLMGSIGSGKSAVCSFFKNGPYAKFIDFQEDPLRSWETTTETIVANSVTSGPVTTIYQFQYYLYSFLLRQNLQPTNQFVKIMEYNIYNHMIYTRFYYEMGDISEIDYKILSDLGTVASSFSHIQPDIIIFMDTSFEQCKHNIALKSDSSLTHDFTKVLKFREIQQKFVYDLIEKGEKVITNSTGAIVNLHPVSFKVLMLRQVFDLSAIEKYIFDILRENNQLG